MRRFLSLFMVLLLALRGLAGDAMAMEQSSAPAHHMGQALSKELNPKPSQSQAQTPDEMAVMAQHLHPEMHRDMHHDMDSAHETKLSTAAACSTETSGSTSNDSSSSSDCHQHEGHCTACGICHSTLATPELRQAQASAAPALPLIHGTARFASAAAFELIKPPIPVL